MAVALEAHEGRHAHAARGGDPSHVVAAEVDEHHVLGSLLLAAPELLGETQILLVGRAAGPRAGDGMGLDAIALDPHEHLGRGAHHAAAALAEEEHVGRGIHAASAR